jgi:hypothetical protein
MFGQTDPAAVVANLERVRSELDACFRRAGRPASIDVSLAVEVDGEPKSVVVNGDSDGARAFARCARPVLMKLNYGEASTLRAGQPSVTGGVVRFSLGKETP